MLNEKENIMELKPTRLVRKIMRKHGLITIFTNKYKTCRTVKCYGNIHHSKMQNMVKEIEARLGEIGVDYKVKHTDWDTYPLLPGIIIRIPFESQAA